MLERDVLRPRGRAVRSHWNGQSSLSELGAGVMASVSNFVQLPILLMVDVVVGGRLVTNYIDRNEKCCVVLDKFNLDHGDFSLMWNSKPLHVSRTFADYDPPSRFTIEVRGLIRGGGTFSLHFVIFFVFLCFQLYSNILQYIALL